MRRSRALGTGLTTLALALALGACSSSNATHTSAANPPAATTTTTIAAPPASFDVGTKEETYVDASRRTAVNGTYPGAPTRTLRVRFYFPTQNGAPATAGAPFPVFLFSHGFTGKPEFYQALLRDIARAGYVIVAPAYPLSNGDAPGGPIIGDVGNQPKDASFVLDKVLAEAKATTWLTGLVDPTRIAAGGHSLGGFTTYGLVYNACCRDARIKAAVIESGAAAGFPADTFFTGITTPLLATHGDHDETVPYDVGARAWSHANSPKFLMTIIGGMHSSEEAGGVTEKQQLQTHAILDFLDAYLRGNPKALDQLRVVGNTVGMTKLDAQS